MFGVKITTSIFRQPLTRSYYFFNSGDYVMEMSWAGFFLSLSSRVPSFASSVRHSRARCRCHPAGSSLDTSVLFYVYILPPVFVSYLSLARLREFGSEGESTHVASGYGRITPFQVR